jgi:hypothetical protein
MESITSQSFNNKSLDNQSFILNNGLKLLIQTEYWQPAMLDEYLALYHSSGIKRPLADKARMAQLFAGANLTLSARIDGKLVGLARCLTDGAFVCYLRFTGRRRSATTRYWSVVVTSSGGDHRAAGATVAVKRTQCHGLLSKSRF